MSRYIYGTSFTTSPGECNFADGRHLADAAIRKAHRAGPQRPDSLAKRARDDADINSENAMLLTKRERLQRSNAHEALEAVKAIHARGPRRGLNAPLAEGDVPFASKSIAAVKRARGRALHVNGHRLFSANELNKAFSQAGLENPSISARDLQTIIDAARSSNNLRKGRDIPGAVWNRMSWQERQALAKGLNTPALNSMGTKPPNSANANWNDAHAATGATNNWRDQPVPNVNPTLVGGQPIGTPSASNRDAALDAIKRALRNPQKIWGNNEDEDDTLDADDDDAKDANRDDAHRPNPNRKRKQRAADDGE